MKELKRLNQFQFMNPFGSVYTSLQGGWMVSNSLDAEDVVQVIVPFPTFEESVEDLLELEYLM